MPLTLRHPRNSNTGASGSSRVGHLEAMSQLGWLITEKNILKRVGQGTEASNLGLSRDSWQLCHQNVKRMF